MKLIFILISTLLAYDISHATVRFETVQGNWLTVEYENSDQYLRFARHLTVPTDRQSGAVWEAGNNVAGKTAAEIDEIIQAIKELEDPIQREMFLKMEQPGEFYDFHNLTHAKEVINQRLLTMAVMHQFNFDGPYQYNSPEHPASTTASNWTTGRRRLFMFRQTGGTAYDAIAAMCDNDPPVGEPSVTYGECWGAAVACIWRGAAQAIQSAKFNRLFPGATALNMDWHSRFGNGSYAKAAPIAVATTKKVPGDWVYWVNWNYGVITGYGSEDLGNEFVAKGWLDGDSYYMWNGENAFYLGKYISDNAEHYEGLGVDDQPDMDLRKQMQKSYNEDLHQLILAVAGPPYNGYYKGVEIQEIQDEDLLLKIKINPATIRRIWHTWDPQS